MPLNKPNHMQLQMLSSFTLLRFLLFKEKLIFKLMYCKKKLLDILVYESSFEIYFFDQIRKFKLTNILVYEMFVFIHSTPVTS